MSEPLFDLTLTEEQRITREAMRRFAQQELKPIARAADESAAAPEGFYQKTMALGLTILPIPEHLGGAGEPRSPIANMLNGEDLGYGDMSLAIGALTPLTFVNTLLDNATEEQQEQFLTPMADEAFKAATIAFMEPRATFSARTLATKARKEGSSYVLNGVKTMVPLADTSEQILVIATVEGEGVCGFVVPAGADGLVVESEPFMGLRPLSLGRVTLQDVAVPAAARIGSEDQPFALQRFQDLASLGLCATAVGCCQAVLDYVVPYVNERVAFGEPISNRQSVAFMVADMAIELDAMRLMVYRAASRAEQGLSFHREACQARLICGQRSMEIGTNGVQLLGGHGFIREHPVEMWYRNLRAVGILQGVAVI
ncbi:MAG: acyl-CoA dehydrogenase family protein [Ketobacteraceae bacterium]|nr:acyl-CoA dehydrogenase family protein [Ketobacteraceae bacterium]